MKLVVVSGNKKGTEIPLKPGETTIGRTADNTIRLTSSTVSRKHAVITVANGSCEVTDLQSTSGTWVNGSRIASRTALAEGSTLQIGEYAFRVVGAGAASSTGAMTNQSARTGATSATGASQVAGGAAVTVRGTGAARPIDPRTQGSRTAGFSAHMPSAVPSEAAASAAAQAKRGFFGMDWQNQILVSLGIVLAVGVVAMAVFFLTIQGKFQDAASARARLLSQNLALKNGEFLKRGETLRLNVEEMKKEAGVKRAWILDSDLRIVAPKNLRGRTVKNPDVAQMAGNALGRKTQGDLRNGTLYYVATPIQVWDKEKIEFETFGIALIEFAPEEVAKALAATAGSMAAAFLLLLIGCVLGFLLIKRVTVNPIAKLQEDTELMIQGLQSGVLSYSKMPELVELAASINRVAKRAATATTREQDPVSAAYGPQSQLKALPGGATTTMPIAESALIAMVGAQPDATLIVDDSSNVMLLNEAAAALFGTQPNVAKGRHILEVVKDPQVQGVLLDSIQELSSSDANTVTAQITIDGATRSLNASAVRSGNELAAAAVIIR